MGPARPVTRKLPSSPSRKRGRNLAVWGIAEVGTACVDDDGGMGYGAVPSIQRAGGRLPAPHVARARRPTMAMITDASLAWETEAERAAFAREVLRSEARALDRVRDRLGSSIAQAADRVYRCAG